MVYHNSTNLGREQLSVATQKARSQDEAVMALFTSRKGIKASASQVYAGGIMHGHWTAKTPLTSIRRSMTGLTKAGKLIKLSEMRIGDYGMPECLYQQNPEQP